jgi:hypothetical protein
MKTYELTYEAPNGDWKWWRIEATDFQAACENALQGSHMLKQEGLRLIRVEYIPVQEK